MLNYYSCQLLEKASIGEDFADLSVPTSGLRQTIDTFSDGDFTTNPNRSGSTDSWEIGQDSIIGPNISNAHVLKLDVSNTSVLKAQRPGGLNSPGAPGLVAGLTHLKQVETAAMSGYGQTPLTYLLTPPMDTEFSLVITAVIAKFV